MKEVIFWGFPLVQLVTAILAFLCLTVCRSLYWRIFIGVWVLNFLVELAGKIMGSFHIHNHILYNLFYLFFYPGIILFYAEVLKSKWLKLISITTGLGLLIWGVAVLVLKGWTLLNTPFTIAGGTVILLLSISYLATLFYDENATSPLWQDAAYWFSTAFIVYFAYITVVIGMYNRIAASGSRQSFIFTFYINYIVAMVLHLCLWKGFWAAKKYG